MTKIMSKVTRGPVVHPQCTMKNQSLFSDKTRVNRRMMTVEMQLKVAPRIANAK